MKSRVEHMEQGVCANCGSGNIELGHIDFGVSILLWFECEDCGCEYIEAYDYSLKGICEKEEE